VQVEVWAGYFGAHSARLEGLRLVRAQPPLADAELTNVAALAGAVALVHRGGCSFVEKAARAQAAGALAVVFVNNDEDESHPDGGANNPHAAAVTIPVVCVPAAAAAGAGLGLLDEDETWEHVSLTVVSAWLAVPKVRAGRPHPSTCP
jgi:hypothetical protein